MTTARILKVFVSSPGDVAEQRKVLLEVIASINRTDGEAGSLRHLQRRPRQLRQLL